MLQNNGLVLKYMNQRVLEYMEQEDIIELAQEIIPNADRNVGLEDDKVCGFVACYKHFMKQL